MTDHAMYEERICALLDGELSAQDEASLRAHLAECPECRAFLEAMEAVYGLAAKDLPEAPADLTQNVMERVRAESKAAKKPGKLVRFPYRQLAAAAAAALVLWAGARALPVFGRKGSFSADSAPAAQEYSVTAAGGAVFEEGYDAADAPMMAADSAVNGFMAAAEPTQMPVPAEDAGAPMYAAAEAAEAREAEQTPVVTVRGAQILLDGVSVTLEELAERLSESGAAETGAELLCDGADEQTVAAVRDLLESLDIPVL